MTSAWLWMVAVALLVAGNEAVDIDVMKYAPKADGKTDDSQAFLKAWTDVCKATDATKFVIPKGTYLVRSVAFQGPCKAPSITVQATGAVIMAPPDTAGMQPLMGWIRFDSLDKLHIMGGTFDGQGQSLWKKGSNWNDADCLKKQKCTNMPINLSLNNVNNSIIQDVTSKDSKNFHFNVIQADNMTIQGVKIIAPEDSPNTDGIHVARSSKIKIIDTDIQTGDDCVSMGDELTDVLVKNVKCGPGHGISIGSLGKYPVEHDVKGIHVEGCTFTNTNNGVRIKTWPSSPTVISVSDIVFTDLTMNNVSNPVIIDQQYCPWNMCSLDKASLIQISNVKVANVKGTSFTQDVVIFACSSTKPCTGVEVGNIDLKYIGDPSLGGPTTKCQNVKYTTTGTQNPPLCAQSSAPKARPK